jgi:hypothetical protein
MKIRSVGAELFHVDRRTDMKLIVAFRHFENAPKKLANQINAYCAYGRYSDGLYCVIFSLCSFNFPLLGANSSPPAPALIQSVLFAYGAKPEKYF